MNLHCISKLAIVLVLSTQIYTQFIPCFGEPCTIEFPKQSFTSDLEKNKFLKEFRASHCEISKKQALILKGIILGGNVNEEKFSEIILEKVSTLSDYEKFTNAKDLYASFKEKKCNTGETMKNFFSRCEKREITEVKFQQFKDLLLSVRLSRSISYVEFENMMTHFVKHTPSNFLGRMHFCFPEFSQIARELSKITAQEASNLFKTYLQVNAKVMGNKFIGRSFRVYESARNEFLEIVLLKVKTIKQPGVLPSLYHEFEEMEAKYGWEARKQSLEGNKHAFVHVLSKNHFRDKIINEVLQEHTIDDIAKTVDDIDVDLRDRRERWHNGTDRY